MTEAHWAKVMKVFLHKLCDDCTQLLYAIPQEQWCCVFRDNWELFSDEDALDDYITEHGL
jgi:hypothetical protein